MVIYSGPPARDLFRSVVLIAGDPYKTLTLAFTGGLSVLAMGCLVRRFEARCHRYLLFERWWSRRNFRSRTVHGGIPGAAVGDLRRSFIWLNRASAKQSQSEPFR